MASFKRARSPINPTDVSPSSSPASSPTLKAARTSATPPPLALGQPSTSTSSQILCTLPPTCNPNRPTYLAGTRELEAHYAMYHAHVCEENGCGCVFPDARLLELHQTECHDPIAAVRQERGEKIFACHLATCTKKFSTPKGRRLHLIEAHGYPDQYFFAVTNKGVGGLLKRWGEGASMLRKAWQPREQTAPGEDDEDADEEEAEAEDEPTTMTRQSATQQDGPVNSIASGLEDNDEEDEILLEKIQIERPSRDATTDGAHAPNKNGRTKGKNKQSEGTAGRDVDSITDALDSLSLVPPSIQFGRGAKRGALQGARGRGGQGHKRRGSASKGGAGAGGTETHGYSTAPMDVDPTVAVNASQAHGRGQASRGGRGMHPIPRGGAIRNAIRGRGRGAGMSRGAMALGAGVGRGMGPGRGVSKGGVGS